MPMKDRFAPNTLETAFLYNDQTKKKGYYGFPLKQQTMHVQIWKDLLEKSGFKVDDIPKTWKEYWSFWCDKVQPAFRKATGTRGFGIGKPMGVESTDSFQSFYTFMDAYNVKLVDDNGKLLVDDPKVKQGLVNALKDYTDIYTQGLHAAVLHDLEGPGQQRRLPQQDDGDDAQLHHLDRGEVVRGLQQSGADAGATCGRQEGL